MDKKEFRNILKQGRLILDGATGSNLIKRGNMPSGVCPEKWILDHKEIMIGLQEDYLRAGSNIIYAPTFTANRIKLSEYDLETDLERINLELLALSKEAVRRFKESSRTGASVALDSKSTGIAADAAGHTAATGIAADAAGNTAAAGMALDAAGNTAAGREALNDTNPVFIAGDLTMTGRQLYPMGDLTTEELIDVYRQQIRVLIKGGADLLVVETMMSLQECRCALIAAKEEDCPLPVMVTMTYEESGRALFGTDPLTSLVTLQALGADAVGVNCGAGPDKMAEIARILTENADIPVIVKPNAGLPVLNADGSTSYSMGAEEFCEHMKPILDMGVSVIGGCCGTDPEFIAGIKKLCRETVYRPSFTEKGLGSRGCFALSSERKTCVFDLDSPFIIVGERINPTGKKALQAQLKEGYFEMVRDFAESQEESGAQILDVNMGMSGIDEKETMLKAIEEVCQVTDLPLSIDSSDYEVMEAALRHYPGRALVNSVSLEKVKIEKMLPLVKKYGAMMILLPLSDEGLPASMEDKHRILDEILKEAFALGLTKSDIIVDGLVATVGANKNAALETLETIRHCKEDLQLPTICGLSNISFGLPERSFVNASFLTMAIMSGLTMAISNPNQDLLADTAFACDLLRNKEDADIRYIEQVGRRREALEERGAFISLYGGKEISAVSLAGEKSAGVGNTPGNGSAPGSGSAPGNGNTPGSGSAPGNGSTHGSGSTPGSDNGISQASFTGVLADIFNAVVKGSKERILPLTKQAVEEEIPAQVILNNALLPAINKVGDFFDKGKYFLPQLIGSATTMERSIEYLEPILAKDAGGVSKKGKIVIATVQGDIHDIGKNLVALMLKNNGYEVLDLGKDVPKEDIVEAALREKADFIALSALMTTTMKQMKEVVDYAKERGCDAKIIIGGAVITQDYCDDIGADGFSKDAASAVTLVDSLI